MKTILNPPKNTWRQLTQRPQLESKSLDKTVSEIMATVKAGGDEALKKYAEQFDKVKLQDLLVSEDEIKEAVDLVCEDLKNAIAVAAKNISIFHSAQRRDVVKIETMPGVQCWRKGVAIQKVGIYIPGGSAPLFSTVLMLGIPAKLAGCEEIVLCTPPSKDGTVNPAILFAANLSGIKKIYKVGGAQAIAAMAYGTESIPAVYKIFGPGNQYVTKAKQLVNQNGVAIDMPAGPSEVLVIADAHANPSFVAADLLSQAEHGADSQVVLATTDQFIAEKIQREIDNQLIALPRKAIAEEALKNSLSVVFSDENELIGFVNEYAPEHLIITTNNNIDLAERVVNAGSIFLGAYTPESAGDYASGTNHTLPTNGYAKAFGGVSLESFMKYITFQKITEQGLKNIGPVVEKMAEAEQLIAHKNSITVRLKEINN
jgi:histidinol dehydrogenase